MNRSLYRRNSSTDARDLIIFRMFVVSDVVWLFQS